MAHGGREWNCEGVAMGASDEMSGTDELVASLGREMGGLALRLREMRMLWSLFPTPSDPTGSGFAD